MNLEQTQKRIIMIEKLQKEIRDANEMLKEELENNAEYAEVEKEASEATSKKKRIKEEILNKGANQKLTDEIKKNKEEISTLKEILSAELFEVYKENQTDEIADANGEVRKFKVVAKLMPKNAKYENRDREGKFSSPDI